LLRLRAERDERDEHVDRRLLELARRIDAGDAGS
jgi:hypothetical protein